MEFGEKNINSFTVIYSKELPRNAQITLSSSSSNSSNSSCIDNKTRADLTLNIKTPISSAEYSALESVPKTQKQIEHRKKELFKKKEEKLIHKYEMEEAAKQHVVAVSKCGRFVKYDCKIGEGGYKVVNKGFDKEAYRDIAWCEVKREHSDSKEKNSSLLKEIEIMLKIDHPNVVKCYAILKDWWIIREDCVDKRSEGKGLVIIQELMGTGTLKGMIKKNFQDGRCILDICLITGWLYQILDVLRYMHCRIQPPIIHRDVKSENCFLVEQPGEEYVSVKIGDFGLATTINHNSQRKTMIGTVGFMAPEVFEEKYDIKVDIYAFGMMVLEVMTNKTPYDDCTNVFQVVSKSIGNHLADVISTITQPFIKEIILACVHPVPIYRPTAAELCEHPIFQNTSVNVNPIVNGALRSDAISMFVRKLSASVKSPVIDIEICANHDLVQDHNDRINFKTVTVSLDVYQAQHNGDLCELMTVWNSFVENDVKSSNVKLSRLSKLNNSVLLQIQYLIKVINGERWRVIFNELMHKDKEDRRCHRSYSTPNQRNDLPEKEQLIPSNSLTIGTADKYTNNFAEYSHNMSIYHKATTTFDIELENYCREATQKGLPYFFNFTPRVEGSDRPVDKHYNGMESTIGSMGKEVSDDNVESLSTSDEVFEYPTVKENKTPVTRFVKAEVYSYADEEDFIPCLSSTCQDPINCAQMSQKYAEQVEARRNNYLQPYQNDQFLMLPSDVNVNPTRNPNDFDGKCSSNDNSHQYRRISDPGDSYGLNKTHQMIQQNYLSVGSNSILPETALLHPYYPHFPFVQDPGLNTGYIHNYSVPSSLSPYNNLYLQQHSQHLINYHQPGIVATQSKVILSSQNFGDVYNGIYYNHGQLVTPEPQHMQSNNTPFLVHLDQSSRTPITTSQSVLTRSLPSIVSSVRTTTEIHQSYVSTGANLVNTQAQAPINLVGGSGDFNVLPRQNPVSNGSQTQTFSQKFNPQVISTLQSSSSVSQQNYSSNMSNSKVVDKSKKKSKSSIKSKYLLKVVNIQENPGETILTFEMMLPMQQMRFTCCLNSEINTPDVSNSVGKSGQFPGDLHKEGILESLVQTVKKICQHLTKDIKSIPLNEDYIFYPVSSNFDLIKLSDQSAIESDSNQSNAPNQLFNTSIASHPSSEKMLWTVGNVSEHTRHNEPSMHTIACAKCTCQTEESSLVVPDYLFSTIKQVVEKLLNPHCKGLIILQPAVDMATKNCRVLEIPADHIFVGLPRSNSSYNVVKAEKHKDFIIARDNRNPESVIDKCVYQIPEDRAVLLDSSGNIQFIKNPSLVMPSMPDHRHDKTIIKELPTELTHYNDHVLDFDQILSMLESFTHIQHNADQSHEDHFDNPVLLEPRSNTLVKTHGSSSRYGSQEYLNTHSHQPSLPPPPPVQFERISCQYYPSMKNVDLHGDLPKQEVQNRKISNESMEYHTMNRVPTALSDVTQPHIGLQKVLPTNQPQSNLQNLPKPHPTGPVVNRMPNVHGSATGPYLFANQNAMGLNMSQLLPNQVFMPPPGISPSQIAQMHHIQLNPSHRMPMPSGGVMSNHPMTNVQSLHHHSMVPMTQHSIPAAHSEQMSPNIGRPLPYANIHQVPAAGHDQVPNRTHSLVVDTQPLVAPVSSVIITPEPVSDNVVRSDTKLKPEQTVGRFLVRPVTGNMENS